VIRLATHGRGPFRDRDYSVSRIGAVVVIGSFPDKSVTFGPTDDDDDTQVTGVPEPIGVDVADRFEMQYADTVVQRRAS
jgi:hypothetical protein